MTAFRAEHGEGCAIVVAEPAVELVAFDLGGVMISLAAGWENACAAAGITYQATAFTPEEHAAFLALEYGYEDGSLSTAVFLTRLHHLTGQRYSPDELAAVYLAIIQHEFPGIQELVAALNDGGYRTACLSNTCALHWPVLTDPGRYPGIGLLHHQCASHLFGVRKPDVAIFRRFEETTGCAGRRILFFDDRPENVLAAQAAGWRAHLIERTRPAVAQIDAALRSQGITLGVDDGRRG